MIFCIMCVTKKEDFEKFDTAYPEQTNCRKVHDLIFISFVLLCDVIIFERMKNYGGKKDVLEIK